MSHSEFVRFKDFAVEFTLANGVNLAKIMHLKEQISGQLGSLPNGIWKEIINYS